MLQTWMNCIFRIEEINGDGRCPTPCRRVAVLHDVREDCGVTSKVLRGRGYSEEEIAALDALTRRDGEEYSARIDRVIAVGQMAITVKLADLDDNMDLSRLVVVTAKDRERAEKYRAARGRLAIALLDLTGVAW